MSKASSRSGFVGASRYNSPSAARRRLWRWRSASLRAGGRPTFIPVQWAAALQPPLPSRERPALPRKLAKNDIDYGAWQFKTFAEAKARDAALFAAWFAKPQLVRFPNGKSLQDLAPRTANALRMVLARHRDETVVLVGHDSVNRSLLLQVLEQPLSRYWRLAQEPCCINEIDVNEAGICVRSVNETQHLEAVAAEHEVQ